MSPPLQHRVVIPYVCPNDETISFRWHFQTGLLKPRMSGYELSLFILQQMPFIVPLLGGHPRIQEEFRAMMVMLAGSPKEAIDRLLPWIRSIYHEEDDDVILLSLWDQTPQKSGPLFFDLCPSR